MGKKEEDPEGPNSSRSNLSGPKIASQNRSDHGGRKRAHSHSAGEIAEIFTSPAAKISPAASDFWDWPQNHRKIAATTAASRRSRAISRPQRPRDTKAQTHEKKHSPTHESTFSIEIFILGLKFSLSPENYNPGPCFSAAREGRRAD